MSQNFYEFTVANKMVCFPVPLLSRIERTHGRMTFAFPGAVVVIAGDEKDVGALHHGLMRRGFLPDPVDAHILDSKSQRENDQTSTPPWQRSLPPLSLPIEQKPCP